MTDTKKVVSLWDAYDTDEDLEENGAWVELRGGAKVRIRSESSKKVREYAAKLTKSQRNIMAAHNWVLPPALADRNEVLVCRHAIVADWKGVVGRDGTEIAYSPEAVERVLTELPKFRGDILFAARTEETYRSIKEEIVGNSQASSSTSSGTADAATT